TRSSVVARTSSAARVPGPGSAAAGKHSSRWSDVVASAFPDQEAEMAVAFIQEFKIQGDDRSTTNYDTVSERLNTRNDPPEGGIVHTAGFDEDAGVFRIFDVW